jgi:folate-binding protein YgfZ
MPLPEAPLPEVASAEALEGYRVLREGCGALEIARDVVRVAGPDAERYLQGQLSQDVASLAPGDWAWSLVLQPQGKLDAFVRLYRVGNEEFLLDTDAGVGEALVARLLRFRLRTKADVEHLPWRTVAVRGPLTPVAGSPGRGTPGRGTAVAVGFKWNGLSGYDLLGPGPLPPAAATVVDARAYEAVRIEAGFPRHGAELDDRTIPAEAGLVTASASFTKGCYTGQELIARIDSRGSNVPRHLRGLLLSGPAAPGARLLRLSSGAAGAGPAEGTPPGRDHLDGPKEVGRLTSAAFSPRLGWIGLGFVGRSVEVGQSVAVGGGPGDPTLTARVQSLPLGAPAG